VAYFESIPADSLPYLNAEVELGEIVVQTLISDKHKDAAYNKLQKVRDRIVNDGEDFAELASIFSDDGSAQSGGDLGWQKRGTFVPEFEASAYNLEENEVSEIVETQFGYHLLQLLGRRGNTINVRHILIKPEVTEEDIDRTKSHLDSIAEAIRLDSLPFELAVRLYSHDESQSYNNAGRLNNEKTGDTFWETKDLPYQIYFAIENLEVGDVSEVLEFEQRGEKIYKIIQLQSKSKPHKASLETDYSKIQNYAKESKKNLYFNNWVEDKIDQTLIEIIDDFKGCPNLVRISDKSDTAINR
jgi:peptidyl-prolyl cis-trans isomerase SurA